MPTIASRGAWKTMSARLRPAMRSCMFWVRTSSTKSWRIRNCRPASSTVACPCARSRRVAGKVLHHMSRIGRRADRCHRHGLGDLTGGGQHRGAAQAVADEN
jgi:hypothetical protein